MISRDAYVENASATWQVVAPTSHRDEAYFRADLPWMTRLILRAPMPAEQLSVLLDSAPSAKNVLVEDVFGGHDNALPVPTTRVLRMPVMARAATPAGSAVTNDTVRVVHVSDLDELAVAERLIVEDFPVPALLPWRRGVALPPHVLGVKGWTVWLTYRNGEPAAAGYTYDDGHVVGLYWLVTSPDHRSAGLGRALMRQIIQANPERPITLVATDAGLPLYESLGFQVVATTTWYTRSPVEGINNH
ncbi:GNAT family N-acetyltransferase [Micromonospora sp. NPDC050397]|uniref:GNAT family N-acetyltransferase n=1 Tax=Micromonospora sp. NPDC050397 TaxID=3364279 RepID=UPI00384DE9E9